MLVPQFWLLTGSSHFGVWGWCWHGVGACPMIEVATLQTLGGPDMSHATFSTPGDSTTSYTLKCEEPVNQQLRT